MHLYLYPSLGNIAELLSLVIHKLTAHCQQADLNLRQTHSVISIKHLMLIYLMFVNFSVFRVKTFH